MRIANLLGMVLLGIAAVVLVPDITTGQPGGKKGKGGGGFGGGFGGGGFGGGGFGMGDPNAMFDMLAKGGQSFPISATRTLAAPLSQFAQERGITNGQITRQQFLDFQDWQNKKRAEAAAGGGGPGAQPFGGGGFGGGPGGGGFGGFGKKKGGGDGGFATNDPDALNARADEEFRKRDENADGFLTMQEASDKLRRDFALWDTDNDGKISREEYRAYYASMRQGGGKGGGNDSGTIIIEEDLDAKPVVFRVGAGGKMPAGLPPWFMELDTDKDGQVALYEWRRAGKSFDDFATWDTNGDGFITPEEALRQQQVIAKSTRGSMGAMFGGDGGDGEGMRGKFPKGFGKGDGSDRMKGFGKGDGSDRMKGFGKGEGGFGFPNFGKGNGGDGSAERPAFPFGRPDSGSDTGNPGKKKGKKGGGGGGN